MAFWVAVESSTGMELPEIIRFILEETGYDNRLCLQNLTEEDIAAIHTQKRHFRMNFLFCRILYVLLDFVSFVSFVEFCQFCRILSVLSNFV